MPGNWLSSDLSGSQQMGSPSSHYHQSVGPCVLLSLFDSGIRFQSEWGICQPGGPGSHAHRQNRHMEDRSQHPNNPLLGTGYESFWLGSRLETVWRAFGGINESHNGYLEVYLNLGLIGALLLGGLLISSYRHICRQLASSANLASLSLAFWTIMLFYNMTEAAFKSHLMWETFLLAAMVHAATRD